MRCAHLVLAEPVFVTSRHVAVPVPRRASIYAEPLFAFATQLAPLFLPHCVVKLQLTTRKRKATDALCEDATTRDNKRVRNRASPLFVVQLNLSLLQEQKDAVSAMDFGSLLNIKCKHLHYGVIKWFAGRYDKYSRDFVIPGRGRIPLDGASVYRTLGLPRGTEPVMYAVDADIEARLSAFLFPEDGPTPLTSRVFSILKGMRTWEKKFKQIWLMYVAFAILAPTTSNPFAYVFGHFSAFCWVNLFSTVG